MARYQSPAIGTDDGEFTIGATDFVMASPTLAAYYTVCNITGTGVLRRVVGTQQSGNIYLKIRITIDGVATEYPGNQADARGFNNYNYHSMWLNKKFNSSLKVEIQQPSGTSGRLTACVDYAVK